MCRLDISRKWAKTGMVLIIFCFGWLAQGKYGNSSGDPLGLSGSGTQEDPWRIESLADFDEFASDPNYWSGFTRLETDVDLAGRTYITAVIAPDVNNSNEWFDGIYFSGLFDGNYHKVTNARIDDCGAGNDYLGLFGRISGEQEKVKNLGVENINITCARSDFCGGLCGSNSGTISNSYVTGLVTGDDEVGGLCGLNYSSPISNCYATGAVNGDDYVGGLVGSNSAATIRNCYSTGWVSGNGQVGGLCGKHSVAGAIINSFWNKDTAGCLYSAGGWAMSTAEMMTESTYVGWNNGAWVIDENADYPHLLWEGTPGSIIDYEYPQTYPGDGLDQAFELDSPEDMVCMSLRPADWDKNLVLTNDIDMSGLIYYRPPAIFTGRLDGQGHVVKNLTILPVIIGGNYHLGLFGKIGESASLSNIGVENVNIIAGDFCRYVGGLCGENDRGSITRCFTTGSITGGSDSDDLGGLCGDNERGVILGSYSSARVTAGRNSNDLGGLCGKNEGSIVSSYSRGVISGGASQEIGGLCGENAGRIDNCRSSSAVSGGTGVGGLCGDNEGGTITCSYYTGSVSGDNDVGGLVGYNNEDGNVKNSYSTGVVNGSGCVGGLVGYNHWYGVVRYCYSTGAVSGNSAVKGGLVGENGSHYIESDPDKKLGEKGYWVYGIIRDSFWDVDSSDLLESDGGTGLPTEQMQMETTFMRADWDFVGEEANGTENLWAICEEVSYPQLTWQYVIGDFDSDGDTDFVDFSILTERWLKLDGSFWCAQDNCDLTNDGVISYEDLSLLFENWVPSLE